MQCYKYRSLGVNDGEFEYPNAAKRLWEPCLDKGLAKRGEFRGYQGLRAHNTNFWNLGIEALPKRSEYDLPYAKHTDLNNARALRPKLICKIHRCFVLFFGEKKESITNILDSMTCKAKGRICTFYNLWSSLQLFDYGTDFWLVSNFYCLNNKNAST